MATTAPFTAPLSRPLDRAATWGHLTFNFLTEIMAEGVYGEMLSYLGEPSVHARIAEFLEQERRHAVGLRAHIVEVGPPLPQPLVDGFRQLSAWLGLGFALRGTGAFLSHVSQLEQWGVQWYGELADRFPPHSPEAERYRRYQQEEVEHREWLSAYQADRGRDEAQAQFEVVEFASIVPAPVDEVFAFYTDTRALPVLLGVPVRCEEDVTHFEAGSRFHLNLGRAPFELRVDAHIVEMEAPCRYVDRKYDLAPFEFWEHHHHFSALGPAETLLSDRLLVRPRGLPPLPENLQPSPWKLALLLLLWWRHVRTQQAFRRG